MAALMSHNPDILGDPRRPRRPRAGGAARGRSLSVRACALVPLPVRRAPTPNGAEAGAVSASTYWRRRLVVVIVAGVVVLAAGRAGAALGSTPLAVPSAARRSREYVVAAGRLAVDGRGPTRSPRGPARRRGRAGRSAATGRCRLVRPSAGSGEPGRDARSSGLAKAACSNGRRRPGPGTLAACGVPTASRSTTRWSTRARPTTGRDPASSRVPRVRSPVHHVRADRPAPAPRHQAGRGEGAVRPGEAGRGASPRPWPAVRSMPGPSTRSRPRSRSSSGRSVPRCRARPSGSPSSSG